VHRADLWAPTPGIEYLVRRKGEGRLIRFDRDPTAIQRFLPPNTPQIYGLDDAQGYRALAPRSFLDFMRTVEPNTYDAGYPALTRPDSLSLPQLDLLRARFVLSREALEGTDLRRVFPTAEDRGPVEMHIYENEDILPRARIVHDVQVMPPADMAREFAALEPGSRAFDSTVWLEELYAGMRSRYPRPDREERAIVTDDRPGRIEFELDIRADGLLVLSEQYAPGWQAVVHGAEGRDAVEERRILRADMTFMAIPVREGDRRVEFVYRPQSVRWGGLISGLALILLLLVPLMRPLETPTVLHRTIAADGSETTERREEGTD